MQNQKLVLKQEFVINALVTGKIDQHITINIWGHIFIMVSHKQDKLNHFFAFRCVESSKCYNHKYRDFAEAIDERRDTVNEDDWEGTAVCDAPRDGNEEEAFVRSDSGDEGKVCCKEEHIKKKLSCSTISDTHRYLKIPPLFVVH